MKISTYYYQCIEKNFEDEMIAKDIETNDIDQVNVGDVTAYDVKGKDHFLASLIDRHNRRVIGKVYF